jgi:hypothetical protein
LSLLTRDGQLQNTAGSIAGTDIQLQWRD